jgi:Glyoxalase-like domain
VGVLSAVVIDCRMAPKLARFWVGVIDGYAVRAYDDTEIARLASLGFTPATDPTVAVDGPGPTLFFQEVREGKTSKNRVHLDIEVFDRKSKVDTLTAQGATVISQFDTWTVLQDPEGNEFCLSDQR